MVNMTDEHKWQTLMSINKKTTDAINELKSCPAQDVVNIGHVEQKVYLTRNELYLLAELTGNEATILKRKISKAEVEERAEYERLKAKFEGVE